VRSTRHTRLTRRTTQHATRHTQLMKP
jgi:hypothetical protein